MNPDDDLRSLTREQLLEEVRKPKFLRGCIRYRASLDEQAPGAPRTHGEYEGAP